MVDLFPMYFLTFSKNPSSSAVALLEEVGGRGSGMIGVSVGSIDGPSARRGLWLTFGRLLLALVLLTPGIDRAAGLGLSMAIGAALGVGGGACLSFRGRFLVSLVALAGGAKFPTGGNFWPSFAAWEG